MKRSILITVPLIFIMMLPLYARGDEIGPGQTYSFPEIRPAVSIFSGYRLVDYNGSGSAQEYEFLHDSISGGGELRVFHFPHRLHLDLDIKNRKDYFGDISYAYKDIVLLRGVTRTLFHNLKNVYLGEAPQVSGTAVKDRLDEYGIGTGISEGSVRFKTPDFPLHLYTNERFVKKYGTVQQRSLGGAGYFFTTEPSAFTNGRVRTSRSRDIDWETTEYTIGINSHLRWIEADFSHTEKRFNSGGDTVLYEHYLPAGSPEPGSVRAGGTYPLSLVPDLKGSTNTLRLHTSYTGKIVASVTLTRKNRENEYSNAKASYFSGAFRLTWMPTTRLTFYVKYKHRERDADNPDSVTIVDRDNPANTYSDLSVRPPISSKTDRGSLTVRYRPLSVLTLRAKYTFEERRRSNNDDWYLPDSTRKNIFSLSGDSRITGSLNLKVKYTHKSIDNPAYNVEPDRSDEGQVSISWLPFTRVSTTFNYNVTQEKRDNPVFVGPDGPSESPGPRRVTRNGFFGTVTFLISKDLSLSTAYSYMHNKIDEDLAFLDKVPDFDGGETWSDARRYDPGVPYRQTANTYTANINYKVNEKLNLNGGITRTRSKARFEVTSADLTTPDSIDSFSRLDIIETAYSVKGSYRLSHGFTVRAEYRYTDLDDVVEDPYDDVSDGTAHVIWITLSRKWE